ncbi:MAG: hypothetical protein IJU90_03565 [Bacteroidales bacterium]|nr:hypothetical protein [Bacteroidales bacterium]
MKKCFAIFSMALTFSLGVMAQSSTNVPFSQYGLSMNTLPVSTPLAESMGGVVFSRAGSNFVNPFNPASYASIQPESFVFDIAMSLQSSRLNEGGQQYKDFAGTLSSITLAFPITSWWKTSAGLLPYSKTEYRTVMTQPIAGTTQNVKTIYDGTGGISQFYWGNAFNVWNGGEGKSSLQAGFNLNYLYGSVARAITYDFVASDTSFFQDTRRQQETRVSNITFDLGLLYRQPLGEKYTLSVGLTCGVPQSLKVDDKALIYTFVTYGSSEYTLDTIFPARGNNSEYESTLRQPLSIGLGLSLERNQRWMVALDAAYSPYSGMKYEEGVETPVFGNSGICYADNYRIAFGGGWIGNPTATRYIGRMGLTGGVHYEKGKLALALASGDWTLDEWGVSLGITFPMRKGRSQLVVTGGYSSFGSNDLLRNDVLSVGLALSSNERWFVKRKYN